jgi:hypothetical protein
MHFYPAGSPPPSAASAIFTVTQQAGIIAGTGMTALNGLSADVQTISTGTTGTDFNVVSSGSNHEFNLPTASATNRGALSSANWSTFNSKQDALVSGTNIKTVNGNSLLGSGNLTISGGGLTVGTTAIASGTDGRVLFQDAGVLQQDASFFWDNTNKRLGVGATPATNVRLDVRAQGALSTDIAFRVRNSANSVNLHELRGDGSWFKRNNTGSSYLYYDGASTYEFSTPSQLFLQTNTSTPSFSIAHNGTSAGTYLALRTQSQALFIYRNGNFYFGASPQSGNGTNAFILENGTPPTTNQADRYYQYSADIVAGNAAPHFRTENGDIVKLYRVGGWGLPTGTFTRTTFNTATVTTAQLAERVAALIQDLRDNHQLLKA